MSRTNHQRMIVNCVHDSQIVCSTNYQSTKKTAFHNVQQLSNIQRHIYTINKNLTNNPIHVTPPLVPRGTRFRDVIRNGSPEPRTVPNSLAQVSPLQHANEPNPK